MGARMELLSKFTRKVYNQSPNPLALPQSPKLKLSLQSGLAGDGISVK